VTHLNANQFDNAAGTGFSLGNSGDSVRVFDDVGVVQDFTAYDDLAPWPTAANGTGPSLELVYPGWTILCRRAGPQARTVQRREPPAPRTACTRSTRARSWTPWGAAFRSFELRHRDREREGHG